MPKRVFIKTMGCQMNVNDSDLMARALASAGYETIPTPKGADLILVNTCAIREKAEQKVYSFLGRLAALKAKNPGLLIAVAGCVAQNQGDAVFSRAPHVDLVLGTHETARLPELVRELSHGRRKITATRFNTLIPETPFPPAPGAPRKVSAFVTIMQGCDNFCAYCVVPYVRGREMSRTPEAVLGEARGLVSSGVREIVLLGQNVNSYGKKEGLPSFSRLLEKVAEIPGLLRLRFTTSHPKDLSPELVRAFAAIDKLCPHIHLPVQSGSDRVLKRMKRGTTRAEYIEKAAALREARPGIAITSDFIAGFPGETEEDFDLTLSLIETVGFDSVFAFQYSDRPVAPSSRFPDKVPEKEKARRLNRLLELAGNISRAKNEALVGVVEPVLVEGRGARDTGQWTGRGPTNRVVNFDAKDAPPEDLTGRIVTVRVEKGLPHSLWGQVVPGGSEGTFRREESHAA
jgi:tRNA-2-methylthio-N6-dimethylallyladenosine synthase